MVPLSAAVIGSATPPFHHHVDLRWVLAYSAGIHDTASAVFAPDAVAHPLFPVCLEWPAVLAVRAEGLTRDEAARGVHAAHDLTVHRAIRPGDDLVTVAEVVGAEPGRAGSVMWTRLETVDAAGAPVATTYQRSVLLGVPFVGEPGPPVRPAPWDPPASGGGPTGPTGPVETVIDVGAQDAHRYTECARIWNPIHTEWEAAATAGLPFLLLHGTATLARAVSAVDDLVGDGRRRIGRIAGRFAAPVPMPSALTIRAWADGRFEVLLPDGSAALTDGRVHWRVSSP